MYCIFYNKQQVFILCYKNIHENFHVSSCRTHNSAKTAAISRIGLMLLYVDTCFMCVMVNVMNKKCLHLSYLSSSASLSSHFSILHCNQFSSNFWLLPQFKSQITSGKRWIECILNGIRQSILLNLSLFCESLCHRCATKVRRKKSVWFRTNQLPTHVDHNRNILIFMNINQSLLSVLQYWNKCSLSTFLAPNVKF